MSCERTRQFSRDWGVACLLFMVGLMMFAVWLELRKVGKHQEIITREERDVLDAKLRIAGDREAIGETRQKVQQIEERLLANKVPDRLERIEATIGSAVTENQKAIRSLDARQRKITDKLEAVLGIPKEEIDEPAEPEAPRP
jgi:hypothetical protein